MRILSQVLESVAAHARESIPFECCGILLARDEDHVVFSSLRAENGEKKNPEIGYELGHKAHLKAVEMEITAKIHIVGYYHSHPGGGTKSSPRDAARAIEGATYLIAAPVNGSYEHAAWRWENNQFIPVTLEVSDLTTLKLNMKHEN